MISLKVIDKDGKELFCQKGKTEIDCVYEGEFSEGDVIRVETNDGEYIAVKLDETLMESIVFVPSQKFVYEIHKEYSGICFDENAFMGESHRLKARIPSDEEIYGERNIALNPYDLQSARGSYPHAYANHVTRQSPNFFERNAINGVTHPEGHWGYPYNNWAGGARSDLEFFVDFGAEVEISKLIFYLRADFPHDSYWDSIKILTDDGAIVKAEFKPTGEGQEVIFPETKITKTIHLTNFTQPTEPFSWAGLTQIEVYVKWKSEVHQTQKTLKITTQTDSERNFISQSFSQRTISEWYTAILTEL